MSKRTSTNLIAVIDLGKTNAKVALVDTHSATETEILSQPSAVKTDSLYPSLDHKAIEDFIVDSLAKLGKKYTVEGVTVTTHGATAALTDASGQLVLPVLDYEYEGIDDSRADYETHRPPFSETGSPALPGGLNIGAQLYWQQTRYPEIFAEAKTVFTWPQYWVHWFSGERYNDVTSLGCHTDLYEPRQHRYSSLVAKMNWSSLFPPTQNSGTSIGTLKPELSKRMGLPADLPIYTGIHDSNASLVPHLITQQESLTVVSTGTWFIVMAIAGAVTDLDESRDTLINVNAMGGCVPSARFMGGRERELLNVAGVATDQAMTRLLSDGEQAAMLLPSMVTATGPFPQSKSRWLGRSVESEPEMRCCAVTLYLALMTHECMKLAGAQGPIYIEGPLAQDSQYAEVLAAVSERPLYLSEAVTGTSVGSAMLIAAPQQPPIYKQIEPAPDKRMQLQNYARFWQQRLSDHAR